MLYELAPWLKVITPQRPPMGGTYVGKKTGGLLLGYLGDSLICVLS